MHDSRCPSPAHTNGRWERAPLSSAFLMENTRGGPVTSTYGGPDGVTAQTTTTVQTRTTTTVDYAPLPGGTYYIYNCRTRTALGLSAADGRRVVGAHAHGLDEQVCPRFCAYAHDTHVPLGG